MADRTIVFRFVVVGILGAVFETTVLFAAVQFGSLSPLFGAALAKELSILAVFALNDKWTFASAAGTEHTLTARLVESHAIRALGVVIGLLVLHVLTARFHVWYVTANIAGILAGSVANYALENIITWETHKG